MRWYEFSYEKCIHQVGLTLGLVGVLLGTMTGYIVDDVTEDDGKEMEDIMYSHKQIGKLKR